jgi:hypothetical protein
MGFIDCKYCNQKITFSKTVDSKNGKMIPLDRDGIPHNCPNRPAIDKQESELRKYPVIFERASDLRDRELIERSYVQISEINRHLIHSRLEIIVRPKCQIRGDTLNHDIS